MPNLRPDNLLRRRALWVPSAATRLWLAPRSSTCLPFRRPGCLTDGYRVPTVSNEIDVGNVNIFTHCSTLYCQSIRSISYLACDQRLLLDSTSGECTVACTAQNIHHHQQKPKKIRPLKDVLPDYWRSMHKRDEVLWKLAIIPILVNSAFEKVQWQSRHHFCWKTVGLTTS